MNVRMIEWVKVEERKKLPDFGKEVLIFCDEEVTSAYRDDSTSAILFYKEQTSMFETHQYFHNVTHWAYFPDPPNDIDS